MQQASLPQPTPGTATHVRSTLLQQSLRVVRNRGNFQRWEAFVDPEYRDMILDSIAPGWLPINAGLAHYLACDRFGLDDATLEQIGEGVGTQLQNTLVGVASRIALSSVLSQDAIKTCFLKLWPRLVRGGDFQIAYAGNTVTIELRRAVLSRSRYFRGTFLGNVRAGSKLFGKKLSSLKAVSYDQANDHYVVQLVHG